LQKGRFAVSRPENAYGTSAIIFSTDHSALAALGVRAPRPVVMVPTTPSILLGRQGRAISSFEA